MKLTKTQLKEIIKEELEKALNETDDTPPEPTIQDQIKAAEKEVGEACKFGAAKGKCAPARAKLKDLKKKERAGAANVKKSGAV